MLARNVREMLVKVREMLVKVREMLVKGPRDVGKGPRDVGQKRSERSVATDDLYNINYIAWMV